MSCRGPAEGQGGPQPVAAAVEGHQLPLLHRSLHHDHLVVGDRGARSPGSWSRTDRTRRTGPDRRAGRRPTRPAGCGRRPRRPRPRWSSAPPAASRPVDGMGPPGHVPGRHHAVGGEQRLRADHPVVEGEARAVQPLDGRDHADAHHDQVGVEDGAVGQVRPTRGAEPVRLGEMRSTPTPVADGPPRGPGGGRRTPRPSRSPSTRASGVGRASTTVTLAPSAVAGGRHLGADEPGADHHHPGTGPGRLEIGRGCPRQSSRVRSVWTPVMPSVPGRRRGRAPVATISPS